MTKIDVYQDCATMKQNLKGQLKPHASNENMPVTKSEHFLKLSQEQASYHIFAIYLS